MVTCVFEEFYNKIYILEIFNKISKNVSKTMQNIKINKIFPITNESHTSFFSLYAEYSLCWTPPAPWRFYEELKLLFSWNYHYKPAFKQQTQIIILIKFIVNYYYQMVTKYLRTNLVCK